MKCLQKFSKRYNSFNIWWTVTSKQYEMFHIMVYLYIKFSSIDYKLQEEIAGNEMLTEIFNAA